MLLHAMENRELVSFLHSVLGAIFELLHMAAFSVLSLHLILVAWRLH